jgi:hypothetical protein
MRGKYYTDSEDRRRFFHALCELCKDGVNEVDMVGSQLCLRDCIELLDELGYCSGDWEVDAGEGEIWVTFYQEEYPFITVLSDGYLGRLKIFWSFWSDSGDINTEALKELIRKHWGKYFPVI